MDKVTEYAQDVSSGKRVAGELLILSAKRHLEDLKRKDWDYEFADKVYEMVTNKKVFITNLGKCTQIDARPLSDEVLKKYLKLLYKEFEIIPLEGETIENRKFLETWSNR